MLHGISDSYYIFHDSIPKLFLFVNRCRINYRLHPVLWNKSIVIGSGDRGGHWIGPFRPIQFNLLICQFAKPIRRNRNSATTRFLISKLTKHHVFFCRITNSVETITAFIESIFVIMVIHRYIHLKRKYLTKQYWKSCIKCGMKIMWISTKIRSSTVT